MTIRALDSRCWTLAAELDYEYLPHYATEMIALRELADHVDQARDEGEETCLNVDQEKHPCLQLVCDGCGLALGMEGELDADGHGLHFPDIDAIVLDDESWTSHVGGQRHRCEDCGPDPHDEGDTSRLPGPDDVPLFPLARSLP